MTLNIKNKKRNTQNKKMKVNNIIKLISKIRKIAYRFLEDITDKMIVLYFKFTFDLKTNYKYSYIIPFLFKNLGSDIPTDAEPIVTFGFNMLILSLIILGCFINIIGYFISIYLITKYKVEEIYPRYSKIIRYFYKSSIFFVIIERLLCILFLILIINNFMQDLDSLEVKGLIISFTAL
uniref:Uncharacterized protein n=1 Tax=Mutinus fleischeri TaxID=2218478 RepID=A0A8K1RF05_9AGAM|nr:hypothetical protein [Mutinus fleischeri]